MSYEEAVVEYLQRLRRGGRSPDYFEFNGMTSEEREAWEEAEKLFSLENK